MLARLLHDIAFGHWETRAVTSYMLLERPARPRGSRRPAGGRPGRGDRGSPDPGRGARRLLGVLHGHDIPLVQGWFTDPDPGLRGAALGVAGSAGRDIPADVLHAGLRDPGTRRLAIYAAGMSGHPGLAGIAVAPDLPADVRAAARWWLEQGGRVAE